MRRPTCRLRYPVAPPLHRLLPLDHRSFFFSFTSSSPSRSCSTAARARDHISECPTLQPTPEHHNREGPGSAVNKGHERLAEADLLATPCCQQCCQHHSRLAAARSRPVKRGLGQCLRTASTGGPVNSFEVRALRALNGSSSVPLGHGGRHSAARRPGESGWAGATVAQSRPHASERPSASLPA
jgi:hypothetical protein